MQSTGFLSESGISSRPGLTQCSSFDRRQCAFSSREPETVASTSSSASCCCSSSSSSSMGAGFWSPLPNRATEAFSPAVSMSLGLEGKLRGSQQTESRKVDTAWLHLGSLGARRLYQGEGVPSSSSLAYSLRLQRRHVAGPAEARLEDDDTEAPQANSSASVYSPSSPMKFNRLESTLPLSSTASSFKASVRVLYSLATHGGLVAFGALICQLAGNNMSDMIWWDVTALGQGLLLSLPPIAIAAFLYLEPVVEAWEVARGVRDAEDEELVEYYLGMTPSQYIPVAVASAVAQEVFFRAALQGGLALALHLGGTAGLESNLLSDLASPGSVGMAAVSGYFPAFAPFSQLHAAVVTAAISGSFDYATSIRSAPNVIVADRRFLRTVKTNVGEWHQRQQLKSIYAPMFTGMLALYFGLEWLMVGNLVAPIVSHSILLAWSMHSGLSRLERSR